jgi:hypothetical protein
MGLWENRCHFNKHRVGPRLFVSTGKVPSFDGSTRKFNFGGWWGMDACLNKHQIEWIKFRLARKIPSFDEMSRESLVDGWGMLVSRKIPYTLSFCVIHDGCHHVLWLNVRMYAIASVWYKLQQFKLQSISLIAVVIKIGMHYMNVNKRPFDGPPTRCSQWIRPIYAFFSGFQAMLVCHSFYCFERVLCLAFKILNKYGSFH